MQGTQGVDQGHEPIFGQRFAAHLQIAKNQIAAPLGLDALLVTSLAMVTVTLVSTEENATADGALLIPYTVPAAPPMRPSASPVCTPATSCNRSMGCPAHIGTQRLQWCCSILDVFIESGMRR